MDLDLDEDFLDFDEKIDDEDFVLLDVSLFKIKIFLKFSNKELKLQKSVVLDFEVDDVKDSVLLFLSFFVIYFLDEIEIINLVFKKNVIVKKIVVKSQFFIFIIGVKKRVVLKGIKRDLVLNFGVF